MNKIILVLTALLMTTTLFSNFAKAAVDTKALRKSILDHANKPSNTRAHFGMIYAGQDILNNGLTQAVALG